MGMTRAALWAELGFITVLDPIIMSAYDAEEQLIWRHDLESSPHGDAWHTSFHASAFPGDDPYACGRAAVYTLLGVPSVSPFPAETRAMFDQGSDLEHHWVRRLNDYGVLLSADVTQGAANQTGFRDTEHWLTGSSDAIILPQWWTRSHCVEVKTTSHDKVMMMRTDRESTPYSHAKYLKQLGTYIDLAGRMFEPTVVRCEVSGFLIRGDTCGTGPLDGHRLLRHEGPCRPAFVKISPPTDGTLIYSSREEPLTTAAYHVSHDPSAMEAGRKKLAIWREHFLRGEIPPHPREDERAKWSVSPCQYCVDPDTLVLDASLRWVKAESLSIGDEIVGFDENNDGRDRSRYRRAIVESFQIINRPKLIVTTDHGPTTCSDDHKFLVNHRKGGREWVRARALQEGDEIVYFGDPWTTEESREAGWLAGMFDGEGTVGRGHLKIAQVEGFVLTEIMRLLTSFGIEFSSRPNPTSTGKNCVIINVKGGLEGRLKALGSLRPIRLLDQAPKMWEDAATWSKVSNVAVVQKTEYIGEGLVIAMATSTKTLITDGMLSHNCPFKAPFKGSKGGCKEDYTSKITRLDQSHMIETAKTVQPDYDYEAKRRAVLSRWNAIDQSHSQEGTEAA